jgi:hypothetical protein
MLIELLVSLVFLAMAFAFVQKEEQSATTLQDKIFRLESELATIKAANLKLTTENADLRRRNRELEASLARWMKVPRSSISPNDRPVTLTGEAYKRLQDQLANALTMTAELQKDNAALRRLLNQQGKGGTDLPNCTVSAGFLLNIDFLPDGNLRTSPGWTAGAEAAARELPGIQDLLAGDKSPAAFIQAAAQMAAWGHKQVVPCGFRVRAIERHTDLALYKRQLRSVEQYFYVRRQ